MSTAAEPQSQPQNNPDSQGRPFPVQAPAPGVQPRTALAETETPAPTEEAVSATALVPALDHDHRFPSHAAARHHQLHRPLDSVHHQHHHHVDGPTTPAPAVVAPPGQNQN